MNEFVIYKRFWWQGDDYHLYVIDIAQPHVNSLDIADAVRFDDYQTASGYLEELKQDVSTDEYTFCMRIIKS